MAVLRPDEPAMTGRSDSTTRAAAMAATMASSSTGVQPAQRPEHHEGAADKVGTIHKSPYVRIVRIVTIIAENEIITVRDSVGRLPFWPGRDVGGARIERTAVHVDAVIANRQRVGRLLIFVGLTNRRAVSVQHAVGDHEAVAGDADNAFDEVVAARCHRRLKDCEVPVGGSGQAISDLIDQHDVAHL